MAMLHDASASYVLLLSLGKADLTPMSHPPFTVPSLCEEL